MVGQKADQKRIDFANIVRILASILAITLIVVITTLFGSWHLYISNGHLFIRLAASIALLSTAFWSWCLIWCGHKHRCQTTWWDPAETPDGRITWEMVYNLTIGCVALDPLSLDLRTRRLKAIKAGVVMWAALVVLACLVAVGIVFLAAPHVPDFMAFSYNPSPANAAMNLSGNLTAVLALVAAAISIYFTHQQLQAKVRADNRQAWIARLRVLIAEVIALAVDQTTALSWRRQEVRTRLDAVRLELELMLNPSERDHRLLMYLIQRLALLDHTEGDSIQDAVNLRATIKAEYGNDPMNLYAKWQDILDNRQPDRLVGFAMRLSHVVLKREWERVKATR